MEKRSARSIASVIERGLANVQELRAFAVHNREDAQDRYRVEQYNARLIQVIDVVRTA